MKTQSFAALLLLVSGLAQAELSVNQLQLVTDSEEPFERRVYSYDFDYDGSGELHAVYSKPIPGQNRTQIIYMHKQPGALWPQEDSRVVLESSGQVASVSTAIQCEKVSSRCHVSYLVERDFVDENGVVHGSGLVYQRIDAGQPGAQVNVSPGAFHTEMFADPDARLSIDGSVPGLPLFVREYEDFLDANGQLRTPPFPKALRLQLPVAANRWSDRDYILSLPPEEDYRLADFLFDGQRLHVSYGNKNAPFLRAAFPTTNPPLTPDKNPVPFPDGAGHILKHAQASIDNLNNWTVTTIDPAGNLSENEFWTDLMIGANGTLHSANYRYRTNAAGIHEGTSAVFGSFADNAWQLTTVAGKTRGAVPHRAGMGASIIYQPGVGYHGFWDNSPSAPIDTESARGSTIYRFSPDGNNWESRQMLLDFSVEGHIKVKQIGNTLLVMYLGDATDARVMYAEVALPDPAQNLAEVSSDKMFYGVGEPIQLYARLQPAQPATGLSDVYFVVTGPYDRQPDGSLIPTLVFRNQYLNLAAGWQSVGDVLQIQPVLREFPIAPLHSFFLTETARMPGGVFEYPGRYVVYTASVATGSPLSEFQLLSPLFAYQLHVCNLENCQEIIN
ncbi:MAG: hypothetical protein RQ715_08680 [Methylococcales bacterium]|nr:hypothetical protein [Methylococcales bacterium]